jgi:4'-phosphopantetheinyl transferase
MNRDADPLQASGAIDVWYQCVGEAEASRTLDYLALLSEEEGQLHASLRPEARLEYLTAHALVRRALSLYEPRPAHSWVFEADDAGRPRLSNAPEDWGLDFNLSHTDGLVACAITRSGRVGIDVEALDHERDLDRVAKRVLGQRERSWWQGLAPEDRALGLLDLWTLKEAHFKALGSGPRWPFSDLEFSLDSEHDARRLGGAEETNQETFWHYVRRAPTARHRLAAAVTGCAKPRWRIAPFPA